MRYLVILAVVIAVIAIIAFGAMPSHDTGNGTQPSPSALDQNP
jgi:hypothetical protein